MQVFPILTYASCFTLMYVINLYYIASKLSHLQQIIVFDRFFGLFILKNNDVFTAFLTYFFFE